MRQIRQIISHKELFLQFLNNLFEFGIVFLFFPMGFFKFSYLLALSITSASVAVSIGVCICIRSPTKWLNIPILLPHSAYQSLICRQYFTSPYQMNGTSESFHFFVMDDFIFSTAIWLFLEIQFKLPHLSFELNTWC